MNFFPRIIVVLLSENNSKSDVTGRFVGCIVSSSAAIQLDCKIIIQVVEEESSTDVAVIVI